MSINIINKKEDLMPKYIYINFGKENKSGETSSVMFYRKLSQNIQGVY